MGKWPPKWDKYEAVLLLDGLLAIKQDGIPRNIVVRQMTEDLRRLAKNRNWEINEKFRNVSGITFQMHSMESAYCGYTVFKPASKLFSEIADMYKSDYKQYEELLKEAKDMLIENKFVNLISGDESTATLSTTKTEKKKMNCVCERAKDYAFKADRMKDYVSVLRKKFKKGFRMESPLEIKKFRRYYSEINGNEMDASNEAISKNIREICLIYNGKAFLPEVMLSDELKDELLHYIDKSFATGKEFIYFQALYNEFKEAFLDFPIYDAGMLCEYLMHLGLKNIFFNSKCKYISKEANVTVDSVAEIRDCLKEYACPMDYEEIFSALSHLPQSKIQLILRSNGEFIKNSRGEYFHESSVILSEEDLENIVAILSKVIDDRDFVSGNELYQAIQAKYPHIIENNSICSVCGFRDTLKYKLGNRFSFKGNIISRAGEKLSMAKVFANYAKEHDSFTLTELQAFANELLGNTAIMGAYFEAVYDNSLRINREEFVSKKYAQFTVAETDDALDRVCLDKYISLAEVTNFGVFPEAGFPWNIYLLEHYVAKYSQKYMLLHAGYNSTKCAGAIVRRNAGFDTFDELMIDILANSNVEGNKEVALQFLCDKGYLARRTFSNIESLLIKAKAQRNRKDTK